MARCDVLERIDLRLPGDPVHGTFVRDPARAARATVVVIAGSGGGDQIAIGLASALVHEISEHTDPH